MSQPPDNSLLTARQLGFAHGQQRVFAGVDLSIARQEIVCLIGASGCGKSTLLRLLAGLERPDQGEVRYHGAPSHARAGQASVVFQTPALLPWLTVADNVGLGLDFACRPPSSRAERQARIAQGLAQVGLSEHARKKPAALSGGMAQRAALARALVRDPAIIYLDEPFSALDAITRESMQDLLLRLARQHASAALLVTHDIDEALRLADRVLLLGGAPARIVGEWRPPGQAPRQHRSQGLNAMRDQILDALSTPDASWYPIL